jgi:hypothetical protein
MRVLAIDPGTHESGYVVYEDGRVVTSGVLPNDDLLKIVKDDNSDALAIEGFKARGNVIDNNCVQTIRWEGRFQQAWGCPEDVWLIPRMDVKKAIGVPGSADDAKVNARLRELVGEKGTKANPGPTFGVSTHAWAALGVAVAASKDAK